MESTLSDSILRSRYGIVPTAFVFVMVSRLLRSKGVIEYCAAAERLPGAVCLLAGDVDESSKDSLRRSEVVAATRHARWLGRVDDVPSLLRAADCFVLFTRYREGIPRAVLEAMATGLPIVTTREGAGGMNVGAVIEGPDVSAVVAAMTGMMRMSPESRRNIGMANRRLAETTLGVDRIAAQYSGLYRQLLESSHTAAESVQA